MNIQSISKEKREVTVRLDADELVMLGNIMHLASKHTNQAESSDTKSTNTHKEKLASLYADIILARDLCQYGHLDNFSLSHIVRNRNLGESNIGGCLSDEDIAIFNNYLEDNDIPTAMGNTDFTRIYSKIVGHKMSEKLKAWTEKS